MVKGEFYDSRVESKKPDTDEYLFSTLLSPQQKYDDTGESFTSRVIYFCHSQWRKKWKRNIYLNVCPTEREKLTRTFCGCAFQFYGFRVEFTTKFSSFSGGTHQSLRR
jgi:hypothetical protein